MARDPYRYFRIEASDIMDRLTQGLIRMREGATQPGGVRELLRLAHTLKGAAHVVNEVKVASDAHALESQLAPYSDESTVPHDFAAALLVSVERLAQLIAGVNRDAAPATAPEEPSAPSQKKVGTSASPIAVSKSTTQPASQRAEQEVLRTVRVDVDEMDQVAHGVTASMVRLNALQSASSVLDQAAALSNALSLHLGVGSSSQELEQNHARITSLADSLASTLERGRRHLSDNVDQLQRELIGLQESTSHLRLTHARGIFIPMERAAVAAAQQLGKEIRFLASGGEMRIDAQLLAAIRDPLLHVVRNAVAHGIETPYSREQSGKDREGTIRVSLERRGSQVAFVCRDDGAGVDIDQIRNTALERGFLTESEAVTATEDELIALITRPGFTTESSVNQIAGRGIGLDAVAAALAQLHGTVRIHSAPGKGTTVELIAPAMLLATDVVLADAGGQVVALPAEKIRETVRLTPKDLVNEGGYEKLIVNGSLLPYRSISGTISGERATDAHVGILIESNGQCAAIGVDRLRGTATLVSRPLPRVVMPEPFVAGVALDPQGTPQIILDADGLIAAASLTAPKVAAVARPLPVLIIDDSLTTRMLEQSILEADGFDVDTAVTAEQALEKARQNQYGLFLVDVEMPGMNGFEFVEVTRADESLRHIPAILVTSRSSAEDRARGRYVGASDYVVKSEFDQVYLLQRIKQLVRSA